jgi:hypothetical protein
MAFKDSCPTLAKVPVGEPIFVLRAQDRTAPNTVRHWANMNAMLEGSSQEKIDEAHALADAMEEWQVSNGSKIAD